jgi:predicted PurR-regulated permease PerM
MQGKCWEIKIVYILLLPAPYFLKVLLLTVLMAVPFYFFNKYLQRKINPRKNGKKLILYFILVFLFSFLYISTGTFLFIEAVKFLK